MPRNFEVKVALSAEEYVAFKSMCESDGLSQSARGRQLILRAIQDYAAWCARKERAVIAGNRTDKTAGHGG